MLLDRHIFSIFNENGEIRDYYGEKKDKNCYQCIVSDDHGTGANRKGSALAVNYFRENFNASALPNQSWVRESTAALSRELHEKSGSRLSFVNAYIVGSELNYFNVGDCRLLFFRNRELLYRTDDHSEAYETLFNSGKIPYDGIRQQPSRLKMNRELGMPSPVEPQFYASVSLEVGDAFLLCTDGFWQWLHITEMELDLAKSDCAKTWADTMMVRALQRANAVTGRDGFAVIAVMVKA